MTTASPSIGPRKHRRLRRLAQLALLLLIAAGLFILTLAGFNYRDQWRLASVVAELDRTDPGWRWEDILALRRRIPDEQNSALRVLKASSLLTRDWPAGTKIDHSVHFFVDVDANPTAQLDTTRIAALREELAKVQSAIAEARAIAGFPEGNYPVKWSADWVGILDDHFEQTVSVSNLLWFDACLRAHDGDVAGALESCRAMVNVSGTYREEPSLMSALSRLSRRYRPLAGIERVLAQGEATELSLADLQRLLAADDSEATLVNGLRAERASLHRVLEAVRAGEIPEDKLKRAFAQSGDGWKTGWKALDAWLNDTLPEYSASGSLAAGHAAVLEYHTRCIAIMKNGPTLAQKARFAQAEADWPQSNYVVRCFAPQMSKVCFAEPMSQARLRSAIAALAAERFRLARGRWPETLAELTPDWLPQVPLDPFDGAPLRIRRTADGLIIYSIGPDGVDNGGNVDPTKPMKNPGMDIGFRLYDVSKRRQAPLPPMPKEPSDSEGRQ